MSTPGNETLVAAVIATQISALQIEGQGIPLLPEGDCLGQSSSVHSRRAVRLRVAVSCRLAGAVRVVRGWTVETVTVTIDLPVYAPLSSTVRALEAARDAQTDPEAKQALAVAAALASRGLMENLARSLRLPADKTNWPAA